MKFNCPGCQMSFFVPDDKIPEGKGLKILCPKCRRPIRGNSTMKSQEEVEKIGRSSSSLAAAEDIQEELSSAPEMVEDGMKTSLLCTADTARSEKMEQMLRQLDFYVSTAPTAKLALSKLRNNRYDLVILDEIFESETESENLVLHHIQFLPMHIRRQFFLCLMSESMPSLDQLLAFRIGTDMVLNVQDLDKAKIILVRALKDHKSFYRLYSSELERKGQVFSERTSS